ncbi:MAG TPA: DUF6551 family protein, partial [Ktedonobacteraceae bacterium]
MVTTARPSKSVTIPRKEYEQLLALKELAQQSDALARAGSQSEERDPFNEVEFLQRKAITRERLSIVKLLENLRTQSGYQRPLNEAQVRRIVKNFNPLALGLLTVSRRTNDIEWTVDGQHRLIALEELIAAGKFLGDTIECRVVQGLSIQEEADLWTLLSTAKAPGSLDLFHARVTARQQPETEINQIVTECDFTVAEKQNSAKTHAIKAIVALRRIYALSGPQGLRDVLAVVHDAWPSDTQALGVSVLMAVYIVLT